MNREYLKCNFIEVLHLRDKLKSKKEVLESDTSIVNEHLRIVEKIIKNNDEVDREWLILLPTDLFELKLRSEKGGNGRINWKKIVLHLIAKYDQPMTSDLLYTKAKINYSEIPNDRTFCVSNISSALHYLTFMDRKLGRSNENGKKHFIYGFHHFFENDGRLKKVYYEKFKMEYNGK